MFTVFEGQKVLQLTEHGKGRDSVRRNSILLGKVSGWCEEDSPLRRILAQGAQMPAQEAYDVEVEGSGSQARKSCSLGQTQLSARSNKHVVFSRNSNETYEKITNVGLSPFQRTEMSPEYTMNVSTSPGMSERDGFSQGVLPAKSRATQQVQRKSGPWGEASGRAGSTHDQANHSSQQSKQEKQFYKTSQQFTQQQQKWLNQLSSKPEGQPMEPHFHFMKRQKKKASAAGYSQDVKRNTISDLSDLRISATSFSKRANQFPNGQSTQMQPLATPSPRPLKTIQESELHGTDPRKHALKLLSPQDKSSGRHADNQLFKIQRIFTSPRRSRARYQSVSAAGTAKTEGRNSSTKPN